MKLTQEDIQRILKGDLNFLNSLIEKLKDEVVEKSLLMLPSVMGHLMTQHIALTRLGENLLKDNPEFKGKRDIVQKVLEEIESKNPGKAIEDVLKEATPVIKERLKIVDMLDVKKVEKPQLPLSFHGEL